MPVKTPYYESRFVRANHPDQPLALWLRETLLLPTAGAPVADVWVMVFDPDGAGNRALKVGYPIGSSDYRYGTGAGGWTARIGDTTIDDVSAQGAITGNRAFRRVGPEHRARRPTAREAAHRARIPGTVPHRQDDGSASARDVRRAAGTRRLPAAPAALDWQRQSQLGQTPHAGLCVRPGVRFRRCTRGESRGRHRPRRHRTHLAACRDAIRIAPRRDANSRSGRSSVPVAPTGATGRSRGRSGDGSGR